MNDFVALPATQDAHSLAEWIEIVLVLEEIDDLSLSEIAGSFPSGQKPSTTELEMALSVLEARAAQAPSLYPYRVVDTRVVRAGHPDSGCDAVDPTLFAFLKIASLQSAPWATRHEAARAGGLFDYPVRDAFVYLQGEGARGVVFGWPPRDGRPSKFTDAVTWLAEQLGFPDGDPDRPVEEADGGADCVVWRPMPDQRTGVPVELIQASVEFDVVGKAERAIPVAAWSRWIKFGAGVRVAFATPHSIPPSDDWMRLNDLVGTVLDRTRLLHLLHDFGRVPEAPWLEDVRVFVEEQVQAMRHPTPDTPLPRTRKPKRQRNSPAADPRAR